MDKNSVPNDLTPAQKLAQSRRKRFQEISSEVAAERSRYFERLALLNGGALTLSVTLINTFLTSHAVTLLRWVLTVSWGFLLAGMLCAVLRNFFHTSHKYYYHFGRMAKAESELSEEEVDFYSGGQVFKNGVEMNREELLDTAKTNTTAWNKQWLDADRNEKSSSRLFTTLEVCAQTSFFLGLIMLIVFSIMNVR